MRRALVLSAISLLSLLAGACGSDSSNDDDRADTVTTEKRTTTTVDDAAAAALEARLMKNVPAGYEQEPDDVGDTGPSDLDKAVRDDGSDDAREVLTDAGFVAGYQRLWTSGDNEIVNFLYQFSKPQGASDYMARAIDAFSEPDPEVTVTQFSVAGVPGSKGFQAHSEEGDVVIVVFMRGAYMAQVVINGTDATTATASTLATEQYNNLA